MAKIKKTLDSVSNKVIAALKQLKPEEQAAKNAKIVGWVD
jgi:hypothetical protein